MIQNSFTIFGDPIGAPRQSRRDKWDPRPCVIEYRAWRDKAREAATGNPNGLITAPVFAIYCFAHVRMPISWNKKKRNLYAGTMHQEKPDHDNIQKAVCDALFAEDKKIGVGTCVKFWALDEDQPRVDVFLVSLPDAAGSVAEKKESGTIEACSEKTASSTAIAEPPAETALVSAR